MPVAFRMNIWYHIVMEIINLKTVSPETRKIIKKQVISLIKKGRKQSEIADTLGISLQVVKRISRAFKKQGTAYLKEKKRGRKFGEKRQLTPIQEKEIREILTDKFTHQMDMRNNSVNTYYYQSISFRFIQHVLSNNYLFL